MAESNLSRSTKTQAKIIQALIRLAKIEKLEDITVRNICSEAGVSIGSFYHHFASKQELLNQAFIIFDETLDEILPLSELSPLEAAKDVLINQTAFIAKEAGELIIEYYKSILSDVNHSAANPQRKYYRTVLHCTRRAADAGLIKEGFSPEYVAELLIKFVRGCIVDWCLHNCDYDVVQRTSKELDLIIGAISK